MKKLLAVIAVAPLMFGGCTSKEPAPETPSLMEASRRELVDALQERDQLLSLVKEISLDMEEIRHVEGLITGSSSSGGELQASSTRLLADIATVQKALADRRRRLDELETKLESSVLYTEELQSTLNVIRNTLDSQSRTVSALKKSLTKANAKIDSLTTEVDSLHSTVAVVNEELVAARADSERYESELSTCYYVAASKQQLKAHNIIETPFLRKRRLLNGDFDHNFFVTADKRELRAIALPAGKSSVLTTHPEGSFEISRHAAACTLHITDPGRFWSLSNYLVIETD